MTLAHRLVTEYPGLAERIRSRYRIVLLDEYQDTNPGQRELLRTIFGGFPVTAVGDTDQTIYKWRGIASQFRLVPGAFPRPRWQARRFKNLAVTWRSDIKIVNVANMIRNELHRPGELPALQHRNGAGSGHIVTHWLHSAEAEARWIAEEVETLHQSGTPWRDRHPLSQAPPDECGARCTRRPRHPGGGRFLGGLLEVPGSRRPSRLAPHPRSTGRCRRPQPAPHRLAVPTRIGRPRSPRCLVRGAGRRMWMKNPGIGRAYLKPSMISIVWRDSSRGASPHLRVPQPCTPDCSPPPRV